MQRALVIRSFRQNRRSLLQHNVRVGPAESERTDASNAFAAKRSPGFPLGSDSDRQPVPGDVRTRLLKMQGLRNGECRLCAGEIVAVGEGIDLFAIGDAVVAIAPSSFAGYVTTSAQWVAPKPVRMSFNQVVTIPVAFITAHFTLNHLAKIQAGDRVLIHAAAGGVGLAAVALAKRAGAEIFATAGSPEKRALLKSMGVAHVMDSRSLDFAEEIMKITEGRGMDVILNSLADQFVDRSFEVIAQNGRFLEIGRRGIRYFVVDWSVDAQSDPALIGSMLRELLRAFARGELESLPHRVFSLREA